MAWTLYHSFKEKLFTLDDSIDFDGTPSLNVALLTSTYSPAAATESFWGSVNSNEVSGTGYTAGGNAATSPSVTVSTGTVTVDANDPATWSQNSSGFSNAAYAVLYKDTGSPATSPLVAYNAFSNNKGNVDGDLTVQFSASGIMTAS